MLAEFGSAVEAVQRAVEAQTALAEANTGVPPDKHINFRIGKWGSPAIAAYRSAAKC